jgi:predicted PurR-regulated permease PerM
MTRLFGIIFSMVATALMGICVVAALTMGWDTLNPIAIAAALGFVVAIPVTWFVARAIQEN